MTLITQITESYKEAMKNRQEAKKLILNFLLAQIKYKKIELWKEPTDDEVISIIKKEVKNLKEWISYLEKSNKVEDLLIEKEKLVLLESYLPKMMSKESTEEIVKKIISDLWITDYNKERWKIMWEIMKDYKWKIDGSLVNEILNNL